MKKFLFLAFAVLSLHTKAQIEIGAKAGLNISNITGDDLGFKPKTGIHFGGLVKLPLTQRLYLQPEVNYSSQGAKWDSDGNGKSILNYLQIPVLLQYKTPIGIYAETGPQIAFLLSAKDKYDGESDDIKEYLKKTDFGWQFGLGYQITPKLGAGVRYITNFTSFYEGRDDGETWKERNTVVQIGLHYMLYTLK